MATDIRIDGAGLAWPEFADHLMALRDAGTQEAGPVYVRAPRRCGAEAKRLIRDLELADCLVVVEGRLVRRQQQPARSHGAAASLLADLRGLLGLSQQAVHD